MWQDRGGADTVFLVKKFSKGSERITLRRNFGEYVMRI
jgi:hypothetical protein